MTETNKVISSEAFHREEWNKLATLIAEDAKKHGYFEKGYSCEKSGGKLVVIGSGIRCVGQFTLESLGHIKQADKVLYVISDPVTEAYVRDLRPDALDLYVLYGNNKFRTETYTQMAEACLYFARQGKYTVAIYYGHPGVFCWPTHRMIRVAKMQGIEAFMLPGISAEDSLLADLAIDPAHNGLQSLEATDLVARDRQLLTDSNVIIWQVGCVGDPRFNSKGYTNQFLEVLIKKLQEVYGKDYEIIHYVGAHYSVYDPVKERIKLSEFVKPEVAKKVTSVSTFFVPPKEIRPLKEDVCRLLNLKTDQKSRQPLPMPTKDNSHCYGQKQKNAVKKLGEWKVPDHYIPVQPSVAARYLAKMSTDPKALDNHKQDPIAYMCKYGLSSKDTQLIKDKKAYLAAKPCVGVKSTKDDATVVVIAAEGDDSSSSKDDTTVVVVVAEGQEVKPQKDDTTVVVVAAQGEEIKSQKDDTTVVVVIVEGEEATSQKDDSTVVVIAAGHEDPTETTIPGIIPCV